MDPIPVCPAMNYAVPVFTEERLSTHDRYVVIALATKWMYALFRHPSHTLDFATRTVATNYSHGGE